MSFKRMVINSNYCLSCGASVRNNGSGATDDLTWVAGKGCLQ